MGMHENVLKIPCTVAGEAVIPTCLWGTCNSTASPRCVCFAGFRHDHHTGRFDNCGLPNWAPWVGGAISIFVTSIGCLYGLFVALRRSHKYTLAWRVAVSSSLSCLSLLGSTISLHSAADLQMPVYGALFTAFGTALIAYSVGIMVVISLAPVARFSNSKLGVKFFSRFMLFIVPSFLFGSMIICMTAGYATNDDQALTDAMGAIYIILALAAGIACPIMFFHMRNFVRALNAAVKLDCEQQVPDSAREEPPPDLRRSSPQPRDQSAAAIDSPHQISSVRYSSPRDDAQKRASSMTMFSSSRIAAKATPLSHLLELRRKVRLILITSTVSSAGVVVVCLTCGVLQFAARTVPLSWVVYYAITIGIGMFACQLAHSAKKKNRTAVGAAMQSPKSDSALASVSI